MTIKIYYYDLWPSSMATRVMAEEVKGAPNLPPIQLVPVDMSKGEHRLPAFLKLNPQGLPPVVENDKGPDGHPSIVSEALGTIALLDQAAGGSPVFFPPAPPCNYPLTYQWASWAQRFLVKPVEGLVREVKLQGTQLPNPTRIQRILRRIERSIGQLDKRLPKGGSGFANHDFLHQPAPTQGAFSVADVLLGSALTYTHRIPKSEIDLALFPEVAAYLAMLEARPSFATVFSGVTLGPNAPLPDLP